MTRHPIPPMTSASQLVTYSLCPRKYAYHYVYGLEPEFRSPSLLLGSAMHSAIGWWFERKLEGEQPTLLDVQEILVADLVAGETVAPIRWKNATPQSLEDEARRLLHLYLTEYGDLPVTMVEQEFEIELADPETGAVFGRPLRGYFDLVLRDNTVVELKTASRGWNEMELVRHLQVGAYAFAWNALHGGPCEVLIHILVKLKREPRIDVLHVSRGEPDTRWWMCAAAAMEAAIEARHFPPSPGPMCHDCSFESACAAWTEEEPMISRSQEFSPQPRDEAAAMYF